MKNQTPQRHTKEVVDLGCAIFSSLLFHVALFLILASTSIFYPSVGSAMRFDFIWLETALIPPSTYTEKSVVAQHIEPLSDSIERENPQKITVAPPQPPKLPVSEQPEAAEPEDAPKPELELIRVKEEIKAPEPVPLKPLAVPKETIEIAAERARKAAEEAREKAARAEVERLRRAIESARQERLAREHTERQRKEAEQAAAIRAEQESRAAEEAKIKTAQEEVERARQVAERARQERLVQERVEQQRKAAEAVAALKAEQEQRAAEEAHLRMAQEEAAQLHQAAERARQERLAQQQAEELRKTAELAARKKIEQERRVAEEARLKAAQDEVERLRQAAERSKREQLAREKDEQKRKADEKARLQAKREEAERLRLAAERDRLERIARQQAEEMRKAADLAAKQKTVQEQQQAAEEARKKAAQEEAARSRKAAEVARQERMAHDQADRQRKATELAAKLKAEQERKAAEEAQRNAEKKQLAQNTSRLEKVSLPRANVTTPQSSPGGPVEEQRDTPVKEPAEQKPVVQKPEVKGIVIPAVHGDLKLTAICKGPLKIAATFRPYPKSRRNRPQTLGETRQGKNIVPVITTPKDDTREAVIEKALEGIYTFYAESGDGISVTSDFTLKLFESTGRARTRQISKKNVSGKTVIARILMPDGIIWEDESAFTGSIEDSNSVTKFNSETGVIWKESTN